MKRIDRYNEKLKYILNKISVLPSNLDNEFMMDALLYRIQSSIETAMDVIAMLCKDLGLPVSDDYSNIDQLEKNGTLNVKLGERLKTLDGLRNVIIHRYNGLDLERIVNTTGEIQETLLELVEVMEDILQQIH